MILRKLGPEEKKWKEKETQTSTQTPTHTSIPLNEQIFTVCSLNLFYFIKIKKFKLSNCENTVTTVLMSSLQNMK